MRIDWICKFMKYTRYQPQILADIVSRMDTRQYSTNIDYLISTSHHKDYKKFVFYYRLFLNVYVCILKEKMVSF